MKLWILKPTEDWRPWYDNSFCHIVRAPDEFIARCITSAEVSENVWIDSELTSCIELKADGREGHILGDIQYT